MYERFLLSLLLAFVKNILAKIWSFQLNCLFLQAQGKRRMSNDKKNFAFGLSALISIENMLRKLYLSVIVVLCSFNAFALNLNALQGVEGGGYTELAPPDTMRHEVFHSKFGNDVKFPKLGDNAKENAVILSKFFSTICMKKDARIETFIALIPLVPKSGDELSVETLDKMLPVSYRCFYSASMEYLLFCEMGGKNRTLRQIFYAFRNEASATFTSLCHKHPEVYCAQLDSVAAFIRNLDYIGDIYPELQGLKSREEQAPIVERLIASLDAVKNNMRISGSREKKFSELMLQLYKDPEHVDLHKYFSEKMCQKIESKELELKYISPDKTWENWDVKNPDLCSFSFEKVNTFQIILSNKPKDDIMLDADETREVRSYFIEFASDGDSDLIDDVNVQTVSR